MSLAMVVAECHPMALVNTNTTTCVLLALLTCVVLRFRCVAVDFHGLIPNAEQAASRQGVVPHGPPDRPALPVHGAVRCVPRPLHTHGTLSRSRMVLWPWSVSQSPMVLSRPLHRDVPVMTVPASRCRPGARLRGQDHELHELRHQLPLLVCAGRCASPETCHDFSRYMQPAVVTVPLVTNGHCTTAHSLKDPFNLTGTAKSWPSRGWTASHSHVPACTADYLQEKVVSSNVVMRVQGKLPTTPHSLYGSPRVSDTAAYDMRYLSISTIDMLFPSPTYEEVKDHDIEHFYSAVPDWYELHTA